MQRGSCRNHGGVICRQYWFGSHIYIFPRLTFVGRPTIQGRDQTCCVYPDALSTALGVYLVQGALNLQKSFWYLMAWGWKNGVPCLLSNSQSVAKVSLTSGYNTEPELLPRIEPSSSFRTLGVYLSASRCQKKQCQVLRNHAQHYYDRIKFSSITPTEAFLSFFLFIRPKINYPLPCSALTPAQCRLIQAPVLASLLPKLHLNSHTPRAVLFAGPTYGGLSVPETFIDQGFGQLTLLLGHLKLGDEIGDLIRSFADHLQLHIGSKTPFSLLKFSLYKKWIDQPFWLTSLWSFINRANASLDIENHWLPTLARANDQMLMDLALQLNFNYSQLRQLNAC
jgi:hypothetical protein